MTAAQHPLLARARRAAVQARRFGWPLPLAVALTLAAVAGGLWLPLRQQ